MARVELQGYTYEDRGQALRAAIAALEQAGSWILERNSSRPDCVRLRLEIQLRSVMELYAGLLAAGLELTRGSHLALTELCSIRAFRNRAAEPRRVLELALEISFLDELSLVSPLLTDSGSA